MERKIYNQLTGFHTKDGAGVHLVRVLGNKTASAYNPLLLLDSFDSKNPEEYMAGFPMHPHRGIETISYVYRGKMTHRDSLGNEDTIGDGEVQWMTAGSGILHEEKLPASDQLLGVQLWLNLPAHQKMVSPAYHSIKNHEIEEIAFDGGKIRLLAGHYKNYKGFLSAYLPLDYYDVHLSPEARFHYEVPNERLIVLFALKGDFIIGDEVLSEKTAALLTYGTDITVKAGLEGGQLLYISTLPLEEPIAWGGPIVMNTREELNQAFDDLEKGVFLKKNINY